MPIVGIYEIQNPLYTKTNPIKEKQDIIIPDIIDQNISSRNGMIYCLTGSGGSGKTSLMLNLFKNKNFYRSRFNNIYYFCPISSFLSVDKHPFEGHDKLYHELTVGTLEAIYQELIAMREEYEQYLEKKKMKRKTKGKGKNKITTVGIEDVEPESDNDEETEIQYNCIIIDDYADILKDKSMLVQLNKMLIKARHLCTSFIFTLQSFYYFPKILRKQLTYVTIFKPKNTEEFYSITKELFNMNQNDALKIYNFVFNEPYAHIDIDLVNNIYYKNFNKLQLQY